MGEKKREEIKRKNLLITWEESDISAILDNYIISTIIISTLPCKPPENTLEKGYLRIHWSYETTSFNCLNQCPPPRFLSLQKILTDLKGPGQKEGSSTEHSNFKHT